MSGGVLKQMIVCMACLGMITPRVGFADTARPAVDDIRLGGVGTLKGNVVDRQGRVIAGVPVLIQFNGMTVAKTTSDASGQFAVTGLRSGLHTVVTPVSRKVTRLWSATLAPPAAQSAVSVCGKGVVVLRGQEVMYDEGPYFDTSGALVGGIAVVGAIVGIAAWTDSKSGGPTSP